MSLPKYERLEELGEGEREINQTMTSFFWLSFVYAFLVALLVQGKQELQLKPCSLRASSMNPYSLLVPSKVFSGVIWRIFGIFFTDCTKVSLGPSSFI